jgi:phosphopantothenoylcysteine synthetase/decarboxylase
MKVLVTGGPTRAYIDQVRYLSNHSTGELAYHLCTDLGKANAKVAAVIGPTAFPFSKLKLARYRAVETNLEMYDEVIAACRSFRPQVAIFSAAVLDFAPKRIQSGKVSSNKTRWTIDLVPAPKIIDEVGRQFPTIRRIGFKLQWDVLAGKKLERFAMTYLEKKRLDGLVLNFLPQIHGGKHPAYIFTPDGKMTRAQTKAEISRRLICLTGPS